MSSPLPRRQRAALGAVLLGTGLAVGGWAEQASWDLLVLDLDGDGLFTTDRFYPVELDYGEGAEPTAWTAPGRNEAFLWLDHDEDGVVDGAAELLGSGFGVGEARGSASGFEALARLDEAAAGGNGDGRIDAADAIWARLRLWVDRDHDGRRGPREAAALAEGGVVELRLAADRSRMVDGGMNQHRFTGTFLREDGTRRGMARRREGTMVAIAFDRPRRDGASPSR